MATKFTNVAFINHADADVASAEFLAKEMLKAGMNVHIKGWSKTADIHAYALTHSKIMLLLLSPESIRKDWPSLVADTAMFRDPESRGREFVPILLGECENLIPNEIRKYRSLTIPELDQESAKAVLDHCRRKRRAADSSGLVIATVYDHLTVLGKELVDFAFGNSEDQLIVTSDQQADLYNLRSLRPIREFGPFDQKINTVAVSPSGNRFAFGLEDGSIIVLDSAGRTIVKTLRKHRGSIVTICWLPDGREFITGGADNIIRVWRCDSRAPVAELAGHTGGIAQVSVFADGKTLVSASADTTIGIWDVQKRELHRKLRGHTGPVNTVSVSRDGKLLASGADDTSIKLWNLLSGESIATLEGHRDCVWRIDLTADGQIAASGSWDGTTRIWDTSTGFCLQELKIKHSINGVKFNKHGNKLFVAATNRLAIYNFKLELARAITNVRGMTRYTNAKVVLVGESTIGKSTLGQRLVKKEWVSEDSTHGMRVWQLSIPMRKQKNIEREVWLWDLAGQPEYRLVHQLFLDETSLALVLFDPSHPEDPFKGIGHWESALKVAIGSEPARILVATKNDRGAATVTRKKIDAFCTDRGYEDYVSTSAKTGRGCDELLKSIAKHIPWAHTPWIATPRLFKVLKDAIIELKSKGLVLFPFAALRQQLCLILPQETFEQADLKTVISLLAGQGIIKPLGFGDVILLSPELLNNYAAAIVRAAREHTDGIGCIALDAVLHGDFDFQDMERIRSEDEDIILMACVQMFTRKYLSIQQETPNGTQLVFPSQFNRELELRNHPLELLSYRFSGQLATVYTTLVVRLTNTSGFEEPELWKNAAIFRTHTGHEFGIVMKSEGEGTGLIKLYFDPNVSEDTRITLISYLHEHLKKHATDVERVRNYICPNTQCGRHYDNRSDIDYRLGIGKDFITCPRCDTRISLVDSLEKRLKEDRFQRKVRQLEECANIQIDNESKDQILIGHMYAIAGESNQIFRQYTNSDHGIDGEIEFRNDAGDASGKRIYVQLKSGDSYTYTRKADGLEIFTIKKKRHASYWLAQAYPVYLVLRSSEGDIRWMNITAYLNKRGMTTQVIFDGEPLNAYTILRFRAKL